MDPNTKMDRQDWSPRKSYRIAAVREGSTYWLQDVTFGTYPPKIHWTPVPLEAALFSKLRGAQLVAKRLRKMTGAPVKVEEAV